MEKRDRRTHHHVFPEQTLFLLEQLLDTLRREFPLPHDLGVFRAVHEAVHVVLELDDCLEEELKRPRPFRFRNRRELHLALLGPSLVVEAGVEVLNSLTGRDHRREERVLGILKQLFAHACGGSEAGRRNGNHVHEEHVGEDRGGDVLSGRLADPDSAGGSAVPAVQQGHCLCFLDEEESQVSSNLCSGHDPLVPPSRTLDLAARSLRDPYALILVLVLKILTLALLLRRLGRDVRLHLVVFLCGRPVAHTAQLDPLVEIGVRLLGLARLDRREDVSTAHTNRRVRKLFLWVEVVLDDLD